MMASSTAPSERRWASTRKSSMTVLGKVPKPINLPSQKLENHGLDPNVEIVPKGTLTWGSRPSQAASSAWNSSVLPSPRGDVSVISPVCVDGRPSSGGSGTRPSSSSSEISSEPTAMVWGPNSRPSSASGVFPVSHTSSTSNRPRSAETRPGSFQLSRFAESSTDNISWGAVTATENLTVEASKRSDFMLSSGDFPSLGSEKSSVQKQQQGQCSGVSLSACSLPSPQRGTLESAQTSDHVVHGAFDSWRADADPQVGEGASISRQNWNRDHQATQPHLIPNMPLQQFGPWHGHPVQPPNGVWYRGHEGAGPYRPLGPPGSYPVDAYYPYVPVRGIINGQSFPRGPSPEASHGQSVISVRPGIYPGPVLYEGCYGPPRASPSSSTRQDVPVSPVGMLEKSGVLDQLPSENQRVEQWGFHAHPDGNTSLMMIPTQGNEIRRPYKVLLKQHECQGNKGVHYKEHAATSEIVDLPGSSGEKREEQEQTTPIKRCGDSVISEAGKHEDLTLTNSLGAVQNRVKKSDSKAIPAIDLQQNQTIKKNARLMEKVEGLNSRTRINDTHFKGENVPSVGKMKSYVSSNDDHFKKVGLINASSASNTNVSPTNNVATCLLNSTSHVITENSANYLEPASGQFREQTLVPGKSSSLEAPGHAHFHNQKTGHNTILHHAKLKFGSYGDDERNNTPESDSLGNSGISADGVRCESFGVECLSSQETVVKQASHLTFKHADLKELAKQRAMKEEERTREQMAKAQAKLEELNRRTSANSKQNLTHCEPLCNSSVNMVDAVDFTDTKANATAIEAPCVNVHDSQVQKQAADGSKKHVSAYLNEQSSSLCQWSVTEGFKGQTISSVQENILARRKQTGYRRKTIPDERSYSEKSASSENTGNSVCVSVIPETVASDVAVLKSEDPAIPPKKRNTRGTKHNNKSSASRPSPSLQSSTDLEVTSEKTEVEGQETKTPATIVNILPVSEKSSNVIVCASDQGVSESSKEPFLKMSNSWKPQTHRKSMRSQQSEKANPNHQGSDNVVWAPVKGFNKNGPSEEGGKNNASETTDQFNGSKAKRAEIERYVPKSVAKELSGQGSSQSSILALESLSSVNKTGKVDLTSTDTAPAAAEIALTSDRRYPDNMKQNRHGKLHSSWRQRNSAKPPSNDQNIVDANFSFVPPISHENTLDIQSSKPTDDLNEPTDILGNVKNHGVDRQAFRQSKAHWLNSSSEAASQNKMLQDEVTEKMDIQSSGAIESNERNSWRYVSQNAVSDHTRAHWLPKSQIASHQSQQVSKGSGGPEVGVDSTGPAVQRKFLIEESDTKHQEDCRDQKITKQPLKDQNQPLHQDLAASTESTPANSDNHGNHGVQRRGQYHGRYHRGGGNQKVQLVGEIKNIDQHFEYKKSVSYDKHTDTFEQNSSEAAAEGHWVSSGGARYGDQARNQPRRGSHFYGPRRPAAVHASGAQNNRE
ncbi:Protein modifier of SNC1 1 [Apostasia shenzhenica]|uniref:Protein modifier of SNC1 1 n=1 Tax=Apostasia shenzhenica TaxID=1088818 RepID=A0A2I0APU9_9ASPA|nr:Protein modifier of SNC1 1 [Apostasia shenzhenica]